jgi:acetyl esterase/lipase
VAKKHSIKYRLKYLNAAQKHIKKETFGYLTIYSFKKSYHVDAIRHIKYSEEDSQLYINIYQPKNRDINKKITAFVYMHGGGWIAGMPENREAFATKVAGSGVLVLSVFYGLAPKHTHPQQIENIYKAMAWLIKNKNQYNIDTDRIFVGGESAGAHLASMVGAISSNEDYKAKFNLSEVSKDIKVKGLVLNCGIFDLEEVSKTKFKFIDIYLESFCGRPFNELNAEEKKDLSPINYVTSDFPPCFLIAAERDRVLCCSKSLIKKLEKEAVPYNYYVGRGPFAVHAFAVTQLLRISNEAMRGIVYFIANGVIEQKLVRRQVRILTFRQKFKEKRNKAKKQQ